MDNPGKLCLPHSVQEDRPLHSDSFRVWDRGQGQRYSSPWTSMLQHAVVVEVRDEVTCKQDIIICRTASHSWAESSPTTQIRCQVYQMDKTSSSQTITLFIELYSLTNISNVSTYIWISGKSLSLMICNGMIRNLSWSSVQSVNYATVISKRSSN